MKIQINIHTIALCISMLVVGIYLYGFVTIFV